MHLVLTDTDLCAATTLPAPRRANAACGQRERLEQLGITALVRNWKRP
ncbi:hypothetical protein OHB41_00205 [Streptomyces sp. NBC_01571]|nr:hypothetical protein [Streptomyces sp. NBC_01571]MCX4571669.1 hypothetical protein [Streptomyces sp. NBC_01571]